MGIIQLQLQLYWLTNRRRFASELHGLGKMSASNPLELPAIYNQSPSGWHYPSAGRQAEMRRLLKQLLDIVGVFC